MKWIKYQYYCNEDKSILLSKKLEYNEANLAIAEKESYDSLYTIEEDGKDFSKEPLSIELGGTNAKTPLDACKNIGAVQAPINQDIDEGYIYQNKDGTTKLVREKLFKYSVIVDNGYNSDNNNDEVVVYADDCAGFIPMSFKYSGDNKVPDYLDEGSWEDNILLSMFKPCVISPDSSTPAYYLDKNNLSKKEDGTNAALSGEDGDVMIEVSGLLYGSFKMVSDTQLKISISNYSEPGSFCFNDFGDGDIREKFYRGRYMASSRLNKDNEEEMRSISSAVPILNYSRAGFRSLAKARGNDYHQNNIYMLFLWQAMYLLLFKKRNSQKSLGYGRVSNDVSTILNCGWSDSKPWIYGDITQTNGVVFLGVEDFYGNAWEFVDGVFLDGDRYYRLTRNPENYEDYNKFEILGKSGFDNYYQGRFFKSIQGTNDLAFLPWDNPSGATVTSANLNFCDNYHIRSEEGNKMMLSLYYGGNVGHTTYAGAFCMYFMTTDDSVAESIGSRLCRK